MEERAYIEQARALKQPVADALKVPAVAYIDLQARLPLLATFGKETRIYQYGAPPTAPLALPPELAGSLKAYEERIERLSAPATRAY